MCPEPKKSLDEKLDEIANGSLRSKIVRLREIFDKVEVAKGKGASNKAIVEVLKEHGLIFDVNNFKNARSRILKERAMESLAKSATGENKVQSLELHGVSTHRRFGDSPRETTSDSDFSSPSSTPSRANRKSEISPSIKVIAVKDGGKEGDESAKPAGMTQAQWSEVRAKERAGKRKQKLNSGEYK